MLGFFCIRAGKGIVSPQYSLLAQGCGLTLRARCKLRLPQAHNLPLRTSCMRQIMPHPLPRGVSGPVPSPVNKKRKPPDRWLFFFRAGKGTRTLDPDLGKVVLYQLSYSRGVTQL